MKEGEFKRFLGRLGELTPGQRERLDGKLRNGQEAGKVEKLVEDRAKKVQRSCPKCGESRVFRSGMAGPRQRWQCSSCGTRFSGLAGTGLHRLRLADKWLAYAKELAQGTSVRKAAAKVGIHRNTAFRWRHRFLAGPRTQQARNLSGIVEADETYFLESFKGRKIGMPRPARKRGGRASKPGLSKEQIPVLIVQARTGKTCSKVISDTTSPTMLAAMRPVLSAEAILCTDGNPTYESVAADCGVPLRAVNISAGIRVVDEVFHVQTVNSACSRLKTWIRRFNGVATRYLDNYLGWKRMLERPGSDEPTEILRTALIPASYATGQ